jgi:protein O-GlcNAc transferase
VVEFNGTSSLQEQLLTMRGTGLFVSVHTSNLANAPMLQPGSAVLEFIPVGGFRT